MRVRQAWRWLDTSTEAAWRLGPPASLRSRIYFTLAAGLVGGLVAAFLIGRPSYASDLLHVWHATRTWLGGGDPYTTPLPQALNPGLDPALYPLPTYLVFAPLAWMPIWLAGGLFMGAGSALAAWGVATTGPARAPLFLSAPFLLALSLGQWAPLLVGAMLVPAASWLLVAKPNLGVAAWLARPSWRTALAIAGVLALSVAVEPSWPRAWLGNVGSREEKFVPLLQPGGFLLVSAAVAWRRAEGRLLIAMSLMPQALFFYDQLLLWLIPRTLRQSLLLSIYSVLAFLLWQHRLAPGDYYVKEAVPFAYSIYLAALAILIWNWYQARRPGSAAP